MRRVLISAAALVAVVFVAALVVPIDPEERRPGTRLSGELASDQNPDWAFLKPREQVFIQTATSWFIPHAVTTVSAVAGGELYIPCGRCGTKRWPQNVERDPNVVLKVRGLLYERVAVPITDPALLRSLLGVDAGDELPDVALFRMDLR